MPGIEPESALDRAYDAWLAGRRDEAARRAVSLLSHDPTATPGLVLASRLLLVHARPIEGGRGVIESALEAARDGLLRAGQAAVRRGNLPLAAMAAAELTRASRDEAFAAAWRSEANEVARALRDEIGRTFGKGSARVAEVPPAPPSLPPPPDATELFGELSGDALFDRLESVVLEIACEADPFDEGARVPRLPLFGELPAEALAALLGLLVVRDAARGETVVREGDPGRDAFVVARGRLVATKSDRRRSVVHAELGPGAIFGEMALVTESPRIATLEAAQTTTMLVIERGPLERLARETPAVASELGAYCRDRIVPSLATFAPCFQAIPEDERVRLLASCKERLLGRGETLVRAGDSVDALYVVATGSLEAVAGDGAEKTLVARIGPGDVAGLTSLVLRRTASIRVRATSATTVIVLPFDVLRGAAERWPAMIAWAWETAVARAERLTALHAQDATELGDVPSG